MVRAGKRRKAAVSVSTGLPRELPYLGRKYPVVRSSWGRKVRMSRGRLTVHASLSREAARKAIREWYAERTLAAVRKAAMNLAPKFRVRIPRIRVNGRLTAAYAYMHTEDGLMEAAYFVAFLPPRLVRYTVAHELAHERSPPSYRVGEHHHDAAFWATLEAVLPGARKLDAELAAYELPLI